MSEEKPKKTKISTPKTKDIKTNKITIEQVTVEEKTIIKKKQKLPMCKMSLDSKPMIIDTNDIAIFWRNINLR